jgi:hypothetical protein
MHAVSVEHWFQLSGLEVQTDSEPFAIVILGDSITDGRVRRQMRIIDGPICSPPVSKLLLRLAVLQCSIKASEGIACYWTALVLMHFRGLIVTFWLKPELKSRWW